ncbi:Protein disulfide-isomerase TMX3 [Pteropus alecto]|uniref:Protein disulfide-isomerase TMX3 n=1 Tax=Pteropus alecto TaxID=9402 RepID=L5KIF9_PTEAL|nr:Protein disulfide-isomerase TMX3 [Pteropus alecto]
MAVRKRRDVLRLCATVLLLDMAFCKGFVEDLDESFKDNRKDDIWLVDFYAPWCGHCKKLEPIWNEVGLEMKSMGSPVKVGKMDATSYSGIASEFGVRGYPTIKLLKGDLAYNYRGPRTKDDIIEFAHRVSGALIRPLPSAQMFEHVRKRHRVFFVYVGGESPLKEKYIDAASELIVYTYFFSASEEVVPEYVTLKEMPAVLVFKDGTYFVYDEYEDGDLSSWINRERFQNYLTVDGFLLYELGDTGKLVAIAVIDEKNTSVEHIRLKSIIQEVARDHRDEFHRDFQFGHMDGNDYINTLLMDHTAVPLVVLQKPILERKIISVQRPAWVLVQFSVCELQWSLVAHGGVMACVWDMGGADSLERELKIPTVVVLNTSNQQYFLLDRQVQSAEDLVQFIRSILDGTVEAQGGDSILQRLKRIVFDAKATVVSIFKSSPIMGCFLFGLPLGVISVMCYGIYAADTDGGYIEERYEVSKSETESLDLVDESGGQQEPGGGDGRGPAVQEPKDASEKKRD